MKYYVQVNRHFMVTVEADSALAAEHIFLELDGVQYSNAFDNEGRKTDTFRGALLDCETISREELQEMSGLYTEALQRIERGKELLQEAESQLESARAYVADREAVVAAARKNLKDWENELLLTKVDIGLEEAPHH